jgi:hypothetical protein
VVYYIGMSAILALVCYGLWSTLAKSAALS